MAGKAGAIRAGRAFVELFADDTRLVRGLRKAQEKLVKFGVIVGGIGAGLIAQAGTIVGPLITLSHQFAEVGGALDDISQRTGMSVEAISTLGYAAELAGTNIEDLERGVRKMQDTIGQAAQGNKTAAESLDRLGLSVKQLQSLRPEDQFRAIAARLAKVEDPAERTALAMDVLGKAGANLLPMVGNLAEVEERARALGLQVSGEDAAAAAELGDAFEDIGRVWKAGLFAVGAALGPMLKEIYERVLSVVSGVIRWVQENRDLVVTIVKISAAVAAGGAALVAIGVAIAGLGMVFGVLASAIASIGPILGAVGSALAFLVSPIGAVTAAVVALGAYFATTTGAVSAAVDWVAERFGELKETAIASFGAIGDALASGDIALAAKVLWLTIKMEWTRGINFLNGLWIEAKAFFLNVWTEAVARVSKILIDSWAGLQTAWTETVDFLADAWSLFVGGLTKAWNTAIGFVRKAWVRLKALFDEDLNAEAEIERINQEVAGRNAGVDEARNARIFEREEARRRRLEEIERRRAGAAEEVDRMAEQERAAREAAFAQQLQADAEALDKARRDWRAAIDEATRKRAEADAKALDAGGKSREVRLPDMGAVADKVSVQGSFSAFALRGFGAGSGIDRLVSINQEQLATLRKIEQKDGPTAE